MHRGVRDHKHGAVRSGQLSRTDAGQARDVSYQEEEFLNKASFALASMMRMCHEQQGKEGSQKEPS